MMKASSIVGDGQSFSLARNGKVRCELSTVDVEALRREVDVETADKTMAGAEQQIMESMHSISSDLNSIPSLDTSCLEKLEKGLVLGGHT